MAQRKELVDGTGIELYNQAKWSRSTVADGKWLQSDTLDPISANDRILASAIHDVSADLGDMIDYVSATVDANKIELHNEIYVASSYLQGEVDMLEAATDVVDIIGTLPELDTYSKRITENDIIKILDTEGTWTDPVAQTEHVFSGDQVYLRYTGETTATPDPTKWTYVGQIKPPNSWKQWSEENDTKVNGTNNYYIGSGNSAFGNTVVFGNNNESKSTDKLIKENNTKVYNTQNFIVGNDNSANTTRNAFVFGSKNYSETTQSDLELDSTSQNNDGFTLAFGLENSAIRNYDIAIGREVLASGGENLVVGAPKCYSIDGVTYNTRTVGYKNINFRSDIEGHDNFAIDSVLSGYPLTAHYYKGGPGYNILYHSHINYSGQTPGSFTAMDNNIAIDSEHVNIDIHNGVWPVVGNRFIHAKNVNFGKDFNGSNSPTITYNNFDNAEQINITGNCSFNNNILLHAKKIDFSGSFFNNTVSDVGSFNDKTTLKTLYAKNNILSHFNTDVLIEASQSFNDNILTNFGAYGPDINIGATVIGNNIFKEFTFDNSVGDVGYISAYNTPNVVNPDTPTIDYNILFNIANLKSSLILTNGAFSKNIMANTQGMALAGYTDICNNIINNVTISASADSAKLPKCNVSQNIILNATDKDEYYPTKYKITLSNIHHIDGNIIINSEVSAAFDGQYANNSLFTQNILFGSILSANNRNTTENFLFKGNYKTKKETGFCSSLNGSNECLKNNIIFKGSGYNTNETYIFGNMHELAPYSIDSDSVAMYTNRTFIYGDFVAKYLCECLLCGIGNTLQNAIGTYIIGEMNKVGYLGSETAHLSTDANSTDRNFIYGLGNTLEITVPPTYNRLDRNFVYGANNYIKTSAGTTTDNAIIGTDNYFGATASAKLFGIDTSHGKDLGHTSERNDRNYMFGILNGISKKYNSNVLIGDRNTLFSDNDLYYSNNILIGTYNNGLSGSCQIGIGIGNVNSGHHSTTIGAYLKANQHQTIMGQYNQKVDGCVRTTSAWIDNAMVAIPNSGIIFAIGNGRLKAYEYEGMFYSGANHDKTDPNRDSVNYADIENPDVVELSNAMLVSANGAVSSKYVLASDGFSGVNISGSTKTASIDSLIGSNNVIVGSYYAPEETFKTISGLGIYQEYNHRDSYHVLGSATDGTRVEFGHLMTKTQEMLTDDLNSSARNFAESAASGIIEYRYVTPHGSVTYTSGLYVKKNTANQGGIELTFGYHDDTNDYAVAELVPDNHNRDQYLTTNAQNKVVWSNKPDVLDGIAVKLVATSGDATANNVLYIVTGA